MQIENPSALQTWLVKVLAKLSEANPDALSKYVMALIKKDNKTEAELKKICMDQLDVFLQEENENFVTKLFDVIKNRSYIQTLNVGKKDTTDLSANVKKDTLGDEKRRIKYDDSESSETSDSESGNEGVKQSSHKTMSSTNKASAPPIAHSTMKSVKPFVQSQTYTYKKDNKQIENKTTNSNKYTYTNTNNIIPSLSSNQPSAFKKDVASKNVINDKGTNGNINAGVPITPIVFEDNSVVVKHAQIVTTKIDETDTKIRESKFKSNKKEMVPEKLSKSRYREPIQPPPAYSPSHQPSTDHYSRRDRDRKDREIKDYPKPAHSHKTSLLPHPPNAAAESSANPANVDRRDMRRRSVEVSVESKVVTIVKNISSSTITGDTSYYSKTESHSQIKADEVVSPSKPSHSPPISSSSSISKPTREACRDYNERGMCLKGDQCPYDHGKDAVVLNEGDIPLLPPFGDGHDRGRQKNNVTSSMSHATTPLLPIPTASHLGPANASGGPMPFLHPPPNLIGTLPPLPHPHVLFGPGPYGATPSPLLPLPPLPPLRPNFASLLASGSPLFMDPSAGTPHPLSVNQLHDTSVPTHLENSQYNPEQPGLTNIPASTLIYTSQSQHQQQPSAARFNKRLITSIKNKYQQNARSFMTPADSGHSFNANTARGRDARTLELRKIPVEMNTISQINAYFQKFGQLVNIVVNHDDDPRAALVTFSSNAEAYKAYKCQEPIFNNRFVKMFWYNKNANDSTSVTTVNRKDDPDALEGENLVRFVPPTSAAISGGPRYNRYKAGLLMSTGSRVYNARTLVNKTSKHNPEYDATLAARLKKFSGINATGAENSIPGIGDGNDDVTHDGTTAHKIIKLSTSLTNTSEPNESQELSDKSGNEASPTLISDQSKVSETLLYTPHPSSHFFPPPNLVVQQERLKLDKQKLELTRTRYELLLRRIENQKALIEKMSSKPALFSGTVRATAIATMRELKESIDKIKAELDQHHASMETLTVTNPSDPNYGNHGTIPTLLAVNSTHPPVANITAMKEDIVKLTKKQILDAELELMAKSHPKSDLEEDEHVENELFNYFPTSFSSFRKTNNSGELRDIKLRLLKLKRKRAALLNAVSYPSVKKKFQPTNYDTTIISYSDTKTIFAILRPNNANIASNEDTKTYLSSNSAIQDFHTYLSKTINPKEVALYENTPEASSFAYKIEFQSVYDAENFMSLNDDSLGQSWMNFNIVFKWAHHLQDTPKIQNNDLTNAQAIEIASNQAEEEALLAND